MGLSFPPARPRPKAHPQDRARRLAARHHRHRATGVSPRPHPHRWLARRQPRAREGQGLRVSPLPVLESLRQHPPVVHRDLREAGRCPAPTKGPDITCPLRGAIRSPSSTCSAARSGRTTIDGTDAGGGTRTPKGISPPAPKAGASTSCATPARGPDCTTTPEPRRRPPLEACRGRRPGVKQASVRESSVWRIDRSHQYPAARSSTVSGVGIRQSHRRTPAGAGVRSCRRSLADARVEGVSEEPCKAGRKDWSCLHYCL